MFGQLAFLNDLRVINKLLSQDEVKSEILACYSELISKLTVSHCTGSPKNWLVCTKTEQTIKRVTDHLYRLIIFTKSFLICLVVLRLH